MQIQPTYIIDFDSTLISTESLDELAHLALCDHPRRAEVVEELRALTSRGMSGELPFNESLEQRLQLFSANRGHVARLVEQLQGQISCSALESHEWFAQNRDHIYVISGGFEDYIIPIVERLNLRADHVFANRFRYDAAGAIIGYDPSCLLSTAGGKAAQVALLKLPRPLIMIGDGYTDYEVKRHGHADEFWACVEHAHREPVAAKADRVITHFGEVAR